MSLFDQFELFEEEYVLEVGNRIKLNCSFVIRRAQQGEIGVHIRRYDV